MNKLTIITLFCVSTALFGSNLVDLQPMQAGDFGADKVVSSVTDVRAMNMKVERQPVSMSWAIGGEIELAAKPHQAQSNSFRMEVDAAAFEEGITLGLTRSGALVRISPINTSQAIHPLDIVLVNQSGRAFSGGSGVQPLLDGSQVENGNLFPAGTSAFRVDSSVGTGNVNLYADNMNYGSGVTYVINVLEKDSDLVLGVQAGNDTYMAGQTLTVNTNLNNSRGFVRAESLEGVVISPSGQTYPLNFRGGTGSMPAPMAANGMDGLWQVRVTAFAMNEGAVIRRDARTAFAVVSPTARFTGQANVSQGFTGVSATLPVEAGVAGRYEVRGILYGTNDSGKLEPMAVGHAADWMTPGNGTLTLSFDQSLVAASGLRAPFAINDLRLIHQDRMSLVHRQANGLVVK